MRTPVVCKTLGLSLALLASALAVAAAEAPALNWISIPVTHFTPGTWIIEGREFSRLNELTPFDGPNVSRNRSERFVNSNQRNHLVLSTAHPDNSATLEILLVVFQESHEPVPRLIHSSRSAATCRFAMASPDTQYLVAVYFDSKKLPEGVTKIMLGWAFAE